MTTKEELGQIVETLSDQELPGLLEYARWPAGACAVACWSMRGGFANPRRSFPRRKLHGSSAGRSIVAAVAASPGKESDAT